MRLTRIADQSSSIATWLTVSSPDSAASAWIRLRLRSPASFDVSLGYAIQIIASFGAFLSMLGSVETSCPRSAANRRITLASEISQRCVLTPILLSTTADAPTTARRRSPLTCSRSATGLSDIRVLLGFKTTGRNRSRNRLSQSRATRRVGGEIEQADLIEAAASESREIFARIVGEA